MAVESFSVCFLIAEEKRLLDVACHLLFPAYTGATNKRKIVRLQPLIMIPELVHIRSTILVVNALPPIILIFT